MSKRCPDCRQLNDDTRIYCSFCGEPLDPNVRLIKNLEKEVAAAPKEQPKARQDDDEEDYIPPLRTEQKKRSVVPWVVLVLAVAAVAVWYFMSH